MHCACFSGMRSEHQGGELPTQGARPGAAPCTREQRRFSPIWLSARDGTAASGHVPCLQSVHASRPGFHCAERRRRARGVVRQSRSGGRAGGIAAVADACGALHDVAGRRLAGTAAGAAAARFPRHARRSGRMVRRRSAGIRRPRRAARRLRPGAPDGRLGARRAPAHRHPGRFAVRRRLRLVDCQSALGCRGRPGALRRPRPARAAAPAAGVLHSGLRGAARGVARWVDRFDKSGADDASGGAKPGAR